MKTGRGVQSLLPVQEDISFYLIYKWYIWMQHTFKHRNTCYKQSLSSLVVVIWTCWQSIETTKWPHVCLARFDHNRPFHDFCMYLLQSKSIVAWHILTWANSAKLKMTILENMVQIGALPFVVLEIWTFIQLPDSPEIVRVGIE